MKPQVLVSTMVGLWTLRLGSYLVARIHRTGKDSRFDEVKHQPGMFFVYWSMQVGGGWPFGAWLLVAGFWCFVVYVMDVFDFEVEHAPGGWLQAQF